ncbi:MAG: PaaI family thioesterase [Lachnospiraceae bacterium]|nr:PaaI family thioesterase [Lachnospiraceae bacterium]
MREKIWNGILSHIHPLGGLEKAVLIDARPGYSKFSIVIPPESINIYGVVHGGFLFTLCDTAAGMATYAYEISNSTQQANINFIKGATLEDHKLYVECHAVHKGRSTVVNQVEVTTETGKLVAVGTYTMFLLKPID